MQSAVADVPLAAGNQPRELVLRSLDSPDLAVASESPDLASVPPDRGYNLVIDYNLVL